MERVLRDGCLAVDQRVNGSRAALERPVIRGDDIFPRRYYPHSVPAIFMHKINGLRNYMVKTTLVKKTSEEVKMTAHSLLDALIPLVQDLSQDLSDTERYRRLLQSLRALFPADA